MPLILKDNLLFTQLILAYQGKKLEIADILVDTGSGTTIIAADIVASVHIFPVQKDKLYSIRGVGGTEFVFARRVVYLQVGERRLQDFEIKIGEVSYGFGINGVLGMDFLLRTDAIIDLKLMNLQLS